MPKRIGNIAELIYDERNIELADKFARKGKKSMYGVLKHDKNREENLQWIHDALKNNTYRVSDYKVSKIREHSGRVIKERILKKLPYFPDRIVHWALMNVLVPIWDKLFIAQTYSCIIGRGIHKCVKDIQRALRKDKEGTRYCLQFDIRKYYDNVDHDKLMEILGKKIKDRLVLT